MVYSLTITDILLIPALLTVLGMFLYGEAFARAYSKGSLPGYRWVGAGLVGLAVLKGLWNVWLVNDPTNSGFYRATLMGSRVVNAHYVSLIGPLVIVGIIFGLEHWFRGYQKNPD